jgi:hypothetical protein
MASRTSEAAYWDTPHSQYHSQSQHYYSSTPSMVSQQQQPRQAPTFNSGPESSSPYSAPPSSNTYYSPFYQGQMNGGMNGQSHNSNAGPNYTTMSSNNGYSSHPSSHGNAHPFGGSHHGINLPSSHGMGHYPLSNHSGYHLSNSGIYQRSHVSNSNGGGDFAGPMSHAGSDLPHPQSSQQHHHQAAYHGSSQHSGSPTIDGSEYGHGMKQKRRQVKNACVNCQKACKRCDEGRPCTRCIKYGLTDTCQDSARKERKRGIKRGPYKRRATTGSQGPPSSSGSQYPASSPFMVMEGIQSAPFLGHHNNGSHGSLVSPHVRSHRDQQQQQHQGHGSSNGGNNMSDASQGMDSGMLNSPAYPSSATSTMPRTAIPLNSYEGVYNRDHFSSMQPPRFTSRHDYDRNSNSPAQSLYSSTTRPNALPPVSAPASSTSFSSSPASGYSSRSLFSPPSLLTTNANFLSAGSHHRLHSDSSVNTMGTGSTAPSLSPRTPMTLSANSSSANVGEMGLNGSAPQSLSAHSSASSPPGGRSNGQGYIHHPGPTTTANLPPTATGAFLNPSMAASNNAQPFPLHIPHSARWRSNNVSINGDRDGLIHNRDIKEEQLAPIKLHNSNDSDLSSGTLSIRYQLPSPRMAESPRGESRSGLPKMDVVA